MILASRCWGLSITRSCLTTDDHNCTFLGMMDGTSSSDDWTYCTVLHRVFEMGLTDHFSTVFVQEYESTSLRESHTGIRDTR